MYVRIIQSFSKNLIVWIYRENDSLQFCVSKFVQYSLYLSPFLFFSLSLDRDLLPFLIFLPFSSINIYLNQNLFIRMCCQINYLPPLDKDFCKKCFNNGVNIGTNKCVFPTFSPKKLTFPHKPSHFSYKYIFKSKSVYQNVLPNKLSTSHI